MTLPLVGVLRKVPKVPAAGPEPRIDFSLP